MSAPGERPWRRLLRLPAGRARAARDVEAELRLHLELCEADLVAAGLAPEAARAEARRRFGDPAAVAAACLAEEGGRQARLRWRDRAGALAQDVAHAARVLRRARGFTLAVVLTLGLGVGATTAMGAIVDAVLLRPLPLRDADRVVALVPEAGGTPQGGSPGLLAAWGARGRRLSAVAALEERTATVLVQGAPERVAGAAVSGRFGDVLGVRPVVGRGIGPADDQPGAPPVVLLGHRLWRRALGADPAAVGRPLVLDGEPRTIVGVLPAALDAALGAREFLVPLALPASQRDNFTPYLALVGRLAPTAGARDAARELTAIAGALGPAARVDGVPLAVAVRPLTRELTDAYRRPLLLILAAAAAVLLIGAANVATLCLARTAARARELAVRAALGAGRGRIARQLAIEHLVLGALATGLALPVAALATRALVTALPAEVPRLATAALDARAAALAALLAVGTSVAAGLVPVLRRPHGDLRAALQGGARGTADRRAHRGRRLLVGAEVALALVLLAGAGLLLRSAAALGRVAPGFDVAHVLTARLALPVRDYPELPRAVRTFEQVLAAVRAEPGVASAALVSRVPLGGSATGVDVAPAEGPIVRGTRIGAAFRLASGDYFRSMAIPLLAGRDLRAADDAGAPPVVVVNAALARRLGGARRAVGRRLHSDNAAFADADGRPRALEIVGVVGDVRDDGPRSEPGPAFYAPLAQVPEEPWNYWIGRELLLVARTAGAPATLAPALRRAVAGVDPRAPLYDVRTTGERLAQALAVERFSTTLLALLGAAGLALAALGIHGVVAYVAAQRTRELGVRRALGATAADTVRLVVRQGMRPVLVGLAVGAVGAGVAARLAAALLFGVSPLDPVALGGATLLLAAVAAAACWGPARRAARVDPVAALRAD